MSRQEPVERAQAASVGEQSLQHLSEAFRQLRARAWAGGRHSEVLEKLQALRGPVLSMVGRHLSFCSGAQTSSGTCESRGVRKGLWVYRRSGESGRVWTACLTLGFLSVWSESSY